MAPPCLGEALRRGSIFFVSDKIHEPEEERGGHTPKLSADGNYRKADFLQWVFFHPHNSSTSVASRYIRFRAFFGR
jgi:hypothetical protein